MTLEELADLYLTYNVLSKATETCYRDTISLFRKHLPPAAFADIAMVTLEHLLRARKEILQYQKPISFNTHRNRIRTLFNFALKEDLLKENPSEKLTLVAIQSKPFKTLSTEEIVKVLNHIQTKPTNEAVFWTTVTQTFYWTGMRRRQLVGLQWGDVDIDTSTILLRSENSKTRREWRIPMAEELKQTLNLFYRWSKKLNKGLAPDREHFVFNLAVFTGTKIDSQYITDYYRLIGMEIGIKVSPHRFRHTIATILANSQGVNLKVIQEILGHQDVKTTCGYILPDLSAMRDALSSLPTNKTNKVKNTK